MKRVNVTNRVTGKQYAAEFADDAAADAWIAEQQAKGGWGKPSDCDVLKSDVTAEVDARKKSYDDFLAAKDRLSKLDPKKLDKANLDVILADVLIALRGG